MCVICHVSHSTCHMSHVTAYMSQNIIISLHLAGYQTFSANVPHPMIVTCHMYNFICHTSRVRYHMSQRKIGKFMGLWDFTSLTTGGHSVHHNAEHSGREGPQEFKCAMCDGAIRICRFLFFRLIKKGKPVSYRGVFSFSLWDYSLGVIWNVIEARLEPVYLNIFYQSCPILKIWQSSSHKI